MFKSRRDLPVVGRLCLARVLPPEHHDAHHQDDEHSDGGHGHTEHVAVVQALHCLGLGLQILDMVVNRNLANESCWDLHLQYVVIYFVCCFKITFTFVESNHLFHSESTIQYSTNIS